VDVFFIFIVTGGPRLLAKMSSGDIIAKEGDLVNLLCSAQGEPPVSFTWEKDQKPLESFMENDKPQHSSLLAVTLKDQASFGKYICHIQDRFQSTTHTIRVSKVNQAGNFILISEAQEKFQTIKEF
jgi:hypothetical protein